MLKKSNGRYEDNVISHREYKDIDSIIKKQMDTLELKSIKTEMKISLEWLNSTFEVI